MATSTEIKQRANALAGKTDVNSITPKEVGGIMYDLASHSENVLRNGGTLGVRKVYESVAAMEADSTNPVDLWGNPIKKGNLVVIYDGTTTGVDNNKIYAFMNPGWELATHLDAGYATKAETDEKLAELGSSLSLVNRAYIDYNRLYNIDNDYRGYDVSDIYDTAWVCVFDNSTILDVFGVDVYRIVYFNSYKPSKESELTVNGTRFVPNGARLALLTLKKESNPNGYDGINTVQNGNFVSKQELYNLFYVKGGISKSTGNISSSSEEVNSTDFLLIEDGIDIKIVGAAYTDTLSPYAFYDESKKFISSYDGEASGNRTYKVASANIPSNAKYVRFSHNKSIDVTEIEGINIIASFLDRLNFGDNLFGVEKDKVLSVKMLTEIHNLSHCFNLSGGLNRESGDVYESSSYLHTDYIALNVDCNIYASGADTASTAKIWFYDKYKNPIVAITSETRPSYYNYYEIDKSEFPSNAVYFRCGGSTTQMLYVINSDVTALQKKIGDIELLQNKTPKYIYKVVGKNLLNPNEFLHGYGYSADVGFSERKDGIMSNKLRLSPGTYTIQGVHPFGSAVVRVCWFNDKDEYVINDKISLDENGVGQLTIEAGESKYYYVDYCRIGLQWDKTSRPLDVNIAQFERGNVATNFEACITELVENPRYIRPERMCFMTGASNAVMNNGWFENACERLGYKHRNVAVSGESVMQHATKAWRGLIYNADGTLTNNVDADGNFLGLYTAEELEDMDVLVTSHTHNYNVAFEGKVYEPIEKKSGYYNANGTFVLSRAYITSRYIVAANSKLKVSTYCRYSSIPYIIFMDESGAVISTDLSQAGDDGVSVVDYLVTTPDKLCYMCVKSLASVNNIKVIGETSILKKTVQEYEAVGYDDSNNPLSVAMDINNINHRIVPYGGDGAPGTLEDNDTYNERYAAGYDYLLKKYAYDCYMLKFNPESKWYGSTFGKPCNVVICSYWHDGYKVFNESAKVLAKRHGALYCDIAGRVGFSYMQTDPTNEDSIRVSRLYCNNLFGNEEDIPIDGVMYTKMGWHATRDVNAPLTLKRGKILAETLLVACSDN